MSQCSSSCPWMALHHMFNTCLSNWDTARVATVALTVQRQALDHKWRWQPIWCQLWRAVLRPRLWAQTLTRTLVLLLQSVIPRQCCSDHSCAFDVASWEERGWQWHRHRSDLEISAALCVGFTWLEDICDECSSGQMCNWNHTKRQRKSASCQFDVRLTLPLHLLGELFWACFPQCQQQCASR